MPAFSLLDTELDAIAAFVLSLRKPMGWRELRRAMHRRVNGFSLERAAASVVTWSADVAACSDLSNIGRERSPAQIEEALRNPRALAQNAGRGGPGGRGPSSSSRAVTVRLRDGQTIRGITKNESAFDLQLLGMDGKLYLLSKDRVTEIVREKSLMPPVSASAAEVGH